ncbi:MAG: O-antigen ligase family protein [Bdellovibrionota bacterium]
MLRRVRVFVACLALLAAPIFVWPGWGDSIREPKFYLVLGLGIITLVLQLLEPRHAWRIYRGTPPSILCFFGYVVFRSAVNPPLLAAARDALVFMAFLAVALELSECVDTKLADFCLWAVTGMSVVYGVFQLVGIDPIFSHLDPGVARIPTAFMGHRTLFGPLMVMLGAYHLSRRRYKSVIVCLLMALAARSSMTCISALAVAIAWLWIRRKHYAAATLAAGSFLAGLVAILNLDRFPVINGSGRLMAWEFTFKDAMETPIFGHGFHSFAKLFSPKYDLFMNMHWGQAHQELLQAFFEWGIVGVFFVSWMFSDFIAGILRDSRRSPSREGWLLVCVAGMANAMGNFPLHIAPLALFTLCGWLCTCANSQAGYADPDKTQRT